MRTISVLGANGTDVSDAVVTLRSPKLDGDTLTFEVTVLEGSLDGATGSAAFFIDHYGSSSPSTASMAAIPSAIIMPIRAWAAPGISLAIITATDTIGPE